MENNVNDIKDEEIFKDIMFNRDEIRGTDETFFNDENDKNNSEDSLDLEESENSVSSDKLDLCDKSMEEEMNKVKINDNNNGNDIANEDKNKNKKTFKHRLSKKDLNTIPLPIFDCPYCANEKIVFNHLINEKISCNYLYNTEKKDINLIDFLQKNNLLCLEKEEICKKISKDDKDIDINKLQKIINVILDNTEYINKYYQIDESSNYLKQKRKKENYNNLIINKNKKPTKEIKRKTKDKKKNKKDSSDSSIDDYGEINKLTQKIIEKEKENKNKNIKLDESMEEKICNSFDKLLYDDLFIDLRRKIKWSDIEFEDKPYNIWEPNSINDDIIEDNNIEIEK